MKLWVILQHDVNGSKYKVEYSKLNHKEDSSFQAISALVIKFNSVSGFAQVPKNERNTQKNEDQSEQKNLDTLSH